MHLDWVTARLPVGALSDDMREKIRRMGVIEHHIDLGSGELIKERSLWLKVKSARHSISFCMDKEYLRISGSPARCEGDGCNVFGGPVSRSLNISACLSSMIQFMRLERNVALPEADEWLVTRLDIAGNLMFDSRDDVREALEIFSRAETGKHKVTRIYPGSGCCWNEGSDLLSAAAYIKGKELRKNRYWYEGKYSENQISLSDMLLRMELRLQRKFFQRKDWYSMNQGNLTECFTDFFMGKMGNMEVRGDMDVKDRLSRVLPKGQARSAGLVWAAIQRYGYEATRADYSKSAWARYVKALKEAGLGEADLRSGAIVSLRRREIAYRMANDWSDLPKIA